MSRGEVARHRLHGTHGVIRASQRAMPVRPSARDHIVRGCLDVDGRKVSYLTVDEASTASPVVLLIHGAGVSARTWVHQLGGLADVLRPIAVDLPGHRQSDPVSEPTLATYADTAYEVLRGLATGPVFVAGHSLGGAVAQVLATRHPEMVRGLVLISTCASVASDDGSQRLLGFVPAPLRRAVFLWAVRRTLLAPSASTSAIELTLEEIRHCPPETIRNDTTIGRAMDLASTAQQLRVPTLILCGGRDRLTAPALSQQLCGMIAGSRLQIVPGAGHMLPLEAPDVLNQAMRDFVASVTPALTAAPRPGLLRRLLQAWRQQFR
jgi:pimeloyl-ACP methyl ester carboxylesterase